MNDVERYPDDQVVVDALERLRERRKKVETEPAWKGELLKGRSFGIANSVTTLRRAPEWHGVLAFNDFVNRTVMLKPPLWWDVSRDGDFAPETGWTNADDIRLVVWLQYQGIPATPNAAAQACEMVARDHTFHPVRDYLRGVEWDGKLRLLRWLIDYAGAEDTSYVREVGKCWIMSAIARVMQPGCKADGCLIPEARQGAGKSSMLRILGGKYFADDIAELGSKHAAEQLPGVWIMEIPELDSMARAAVSRIKAFMSRNVDHYRPAYGRRAEDFPRQCVFAGTTNSSEYLRDETGGRRFWPFECGKINLTALERDRDQLWAEAYARYEIGQKRWLEDGEVIRAAEEEQKARFKSDSWLPRIEEYIEGKQFVTVGEILNVLGVPSERHPQHDDTVARYLKHLGWRRRQRRMPSRRTPKWGYVPADVDRRGAQNP